LEAAPMQQPGGPTSAAPADSAADSQAALESHARAASRTAPRRRVSALLLAALLHLRDWAPLIYDGVGVVALLFGAYVLRQKMSLPLGCYDEGVVLTHTRMVTWGYWPYRDFFTQYPPGLFFLLAALWKVFGTQVMVARHLCEVFRVGLSLLAGVAAGQMVGRRFAALPAGLLLMFLARLTPSPTAWEGGLMFALASVIALSHAAKTRERGAWIVAGAMLGLTLSFRHDLFMYFLAAMSPGVVCWVRDRALSRQQALRLLGWTAVGLAIPFAIFWLPTLVVAKWRTILDDGFLTNVRYVMPSRRLPLPKLLSPLPGHKLPMCLIDWPCMLFLIVLAAPAMGLLQTLRARSPQVDRVSAGLVTALSLAVIPQATGRADTVHAVYALGPGMILASSFAMGFGHRLTWRGGLAGLALIAFCAWGSRVVYPPHGPLNGQVGDWQLNGSPGALDVPDSQAGSRRELRAYVQRHSAPKEEIFIGSKTHAQIMVNELDLYFVLDRPGATRFLQFDPGTVTREEVQADMIRTLDAKQIHMVILASPPFAHEPNDSAKMGSTLLDTYIRARYKLATTIGPYEVRFRDGT
jgi:hypothetical protein